MYYLIKENMMNITPVDRPRMMYIMPRTLRYWAESNLGISVTVKQARHEIARNEP